MDRVQSRQLLIAGTAVVAVGLVVGALLLDGGRGEGRRFDGRIWRLAGPEDDDRLLMADDLLRRGKLEGLTRKRVLRLLGAPGVTDRFPGGDVAYRLGLERSYMPVDFEWLVIRFDDKDRVERSWIAVD